MNATPEEILSWFTPEEIETRRASLAVLSEAKRDLQSKTDTYNDLLSRAQQAKIDMDAAQTHLDSIPRG